MSEYATSMMETIKKDYEENYRTIAFSFLVMRYKDAGKVQDVGIYRNNYYIMIEGEVYEVKSSFIMRTVLYSLVKDKELISKIKPVKKVN